MSQREGGARTVPPQSAGTCRVRTSCSLHQSLSPLLLQARALILHARSAADIWQGHSLERFY